jgi:hypothetical protein
MRFRQACFALASLTCLIVGAGCSSKDDESTPPLSDWQLPPATSGSRLRAKFLVAGDVRELVGFHDTARNEDCMFQPAEPGHMRCLPANISYFVNGLFTEATCQVPFGFTTAACATEAKYAAGSVSNGACGASPTPLRKITAPNGPFFTTSLGGCTPSPAPAQTANGTTIALGDEVGWAELVEGVATTVVTDGIAERQLIGADGSRQHLGFRDAKFDADCTFQVMSDGAARCVPDGGVGQVFYADSACRLASSVVQLAHACQNAADRRLWVERSASAGQCDPLRAVYSLRETSGSGAEAPEGYEWLGETCAVGNARYGAPNISVTRGIDATVTASLPNLERTGRRGAGRLVRALVGRGGTRELTLGWHDTERDFDCTFELASDGKMRCLPTAAGIKVFSSDDKCASPSQLAVLLEVSCLASTDGFGRLVSTTCPPTTRVFALGTDLRALPSASTETSPGRCVKVAGVANAYDATEVDPSQFVEGTPVVE